MIIGGSVPFGIHDIARSRHRHDLGLRLAHVGAGEERQLAQGHLLDVSCIDSLDAVNVLEEHQLVDDEALHLVGAHADVLQEDVDPRLIERGEDVHAHPAVSKDAAADQAARPASGS